MYLVAVELLFSHFAIDITEDSLFRREKDLHEIASQVIHRSRRRPGRDYVRAWQEIGVR